MNYVKIYETSYGNIMVDFDQIRSLVSEFKPQSILEIGAGGGRLLPLYRTLKIKTTLVEPNDDMISILQAKLTVEDKTHISVFQNFSFDLSVLQDGSFDFILVPYASINEMSPFHFTISEIQRLLKPGGIFYFVAMNCLDSATSSLGLERADVQKTTSSISAESYPVQGKGQFMFETLVEQRTPHGFQKFLIEQCRPPRSHWVDHLRKAGFEIVATYGGMGADEFIETKSKILSVVAKKAAPLAVRNQNAIGAERIYDSMAPKYASIASGGHYEVPKWIRSCLDKFSKMNPIIHDIGCATGTLGNILQEMGLTPSFLLGTDLSLEMVKICRQNPFYNAVAKWDISAGLPDYKEFLYDIIVSVGVLEFIDDVPMILKTIASSLKIGGDALLTLESSDHGRRETVLDLPFGKITRYAFSKNEVTDLIQGAGLKILSIEHGEAYTSPATGERVSYYYCHLKRIFK